MRGIVAIFASKRGARWKGKEIRGGFFMAERGRTMVIAWKMWSRGTFAQVGSFGKSAGVVCAAIPLNTRTRAGCSLVRFSIWRTGADTAQSEQAFSDDGGKTWEVNWINGYSRIKDE
jgi:hypothetical protein